MPPLVAVTVMVRLARSLPMPTCATTTPVASVVVPLTVATALLFTLIADRNRRQRDAAGADRGRRWR